MRTATTELLTAVNAALDGLPLRRTLAGLGVPPSRAGAAAAAISRARNGAPLSLEAENELRGYLGLTLLDPNQDTDARCPDCGNPHRARRCYGKEIIDVVTLSPGQQVISEPPPGHLLAIHQGAVEAVLCRSEIKQCACGIWFVPRSWNHRRCRPSCQGRTQN